MQKDKNWVTWLKGKHLTLLTLQVDGCACVFQSARLYHYPIGGIAKCLFPCYFQPHTYLWSAGTGMGTGWRQHRKDLVTALWNFVVQKGRHKHTDSPDLRQKWCTITSRALINLSPMGVIMGTMGWNSTIPYIHITGEKGAVFLTALH